MKILFAAAEAAPFVKVGGLADVIGFLPKTLKQLGVDIRICLPKYGVIDFKKYPFNLSIERIKVFSEFINIYKGFLPKSEVIVYLFENEKYFGENGIYNEKNDFKVFKKFLFFSKAILEIFPYIDFSPQIIHCHDWHTAILPLLIKIKKFKIKTVLTIHNLLNQGKWNPEEILDFLKLKERDFPTLKVRDKQGDFNVLQQGILNSDLLTTVSKSYKKEILEKGEGLKEDLKKRKEKFFAILNGIDYEFFNPATDPYIKINYSNLNFAKKIENKIHLQRLLKLPQKREIPLFSFIGRLDLQKGIDLILEIAPELIKIPSQLIILGKGKKEYEKEFSKLEKAFPKHISAQIKFDPASAQKIYSGSDFFLMPSKFEPCGLVSMIAQRYGSIPIARKTGGLAEIIEDKKTGFLFDEYKTSTFLNSIKEALKHYQNKREWKKLIKNAMRKDFSWKLPAKKYFELYKKLAK